MALSVGTRHGPYEIVAPIGAGGMGEVYRARDTKLGRDVALKVLPEVFAHDAERMARFEREAQVLASLNHPHIATIHGLEESNEVRALVMELVEGPTLAERIGGQPMPLEDALPIARQIADGLEYAHERGIIHRDLKPANVKLTADGNVKILDFGLAKALETPTPQGNPSISPTLTLEGTRAGVILGTAAYMAPEQARGAIVDKRADIWAFGVVLYEMLTGNQPFDGATVSDKLAAVLRAEPDLDAVSAGMRRLVRRCLEKDPKRRMRDIGEARLALEEGPELAPRPVEKSAGLWRVATGVLTVIAATLAFAYYRVTQPAELKPLVRLDVDLGPNVSLDSPSGADAILSPDGTRLVYVSQGKLFTRKLDQTKATELAGTDGAFSPFFSPDGKWVAVFVNGKLKKFSLEGGAPVVLCDAPIAYGGSWGEDSNIIASLFSSGTLSRIPSTGGAPTPVTELAPGEVTRRWPQVLPGSKAVLFTSITADGANIDVVSLTDRRRKTLQRGGIFGRYLPSGHVLYMNNGTLFAMAFDLEGLEARGTPVPVLEQVGYNPAYGYAQLDFSGAPSGPGMLLYRSGGAAGSGLVTVQWLDGESKTRPLLAKPGRYARPHLSPDGQRLALEITEGSNRDIWIYDWQRDTMTRMTFDAGGPAMNPVWSPDGRFIVFEGKGGLFWTRSDGAGKPQPLTQSKNQQFPFSFSSDGKRLSWHESTESGRFALWTVPLEADGTGLRGGKPESFLQAPFDVRQPMFSPDGRWLAYSSNESGTYQVYVRAFPDRGGKWQISNDVGSYPVWSHNGRELFFRSGDNRIMVVAYTVKGDSIVADRPKVWSEKRLANFGIAATWSYDLAPDGKRVAALMPVETPEAEQAENHVTFLLNFFDELRRRVPANK